MARQINRLTDLHVKRAKRVGLHHDGLGLYLKVDAGGSKAWVFRYRVGARLRDHGLGPVHTITLAEAREKATACRKLRLDGLDPIAEKRAKKAAEQIAAGRAVTFAECVDRYLKSHADGWRRQTVEAWTQSLRDYVTPVLGALPVSAIETPEVLRVLEPAWKSVPVTASRVRGRIEAVLDYAKVHGLRTGENPARWKGHLDHVLTEISEVSPVEHHPALPYKNMPALMAAIRADDSAAARCLELLILTAVRRDEAREATWGEFKLDEKLWTILGERMKAGKEHKIPLSAPAVALLQTMRAAAGQVKPDQRLFDLGTHAMTRWLARRDVGAGASVHGMRSCFADWGAEQTNFPSEIRDSALAHEVGDAVKQAYQRTRFFDRRAELMAAWGSFCTGAGAGVVSMRVRA
jgi:integrase